MEHTPVPALPSTTLPLSLNTQLARITSICKSLDVAITSANFDFIKRDCSDDVVVSSPRRHSTHLDGAPLSALLICIEISVEQSAIGYRAAAINHFVA